MSSFAVGAVGAAVRDDEICWGEPERIFASSDENPRAVIKGHILTEGFSVLEMRAMLLHIRSVGMPTSAMLATEQIYKDSLAQLVEVTAPQAAYRITAFCEYFAWASPRKATVKTLMPSDRWVQTLAGFYEADPGCCVTRLRWRPSRNLAKG